MKPKEVVTRSFKLYPTTDQAAKYVCAGMILNVLLFFSYFIFLERYGRRQYAIFYSYVWLVAAILKDSDFSEADRAECQFTTTATILDNGSQVCSNFIAYFLQSHGEKSNMRYFDLSYILFLCLYVTSCHLPFRKRKQLLA